MIFILVRPGLVIKVIKQRTRVALHAGFILKNVQLGLIRRTGRIASEVVKKVFIQLNACLIAKLIKLSAIVNGEINLCRTGQLILLKKVQGRSFLFRFRKRKVDDSVLVKKFQIRITVFNENTTVFNDAMPNPPVVKEQEVAIIFGFVGRVKIIVMTNRLPVGLLYCICLSDKIGR